MKTREAISTNYSTEDFNTTYVRPDEFENYNRIWDRIDYITFFPEEIHVMTNMAITSNQTQSTCPDNPLIKNVECDPSKNHCRKGFKTSNGVLTGRCVKADFPLDHFRRLNNGYACEMKGWCPVDRILVPLNNYKPVLIDTINTTLYIDNSVEFPNKNIFINNLVFDNNCYYNPKSHPHCPVFKLGEIIKHTKNAGDNYEEIAKFGATIIVYVEYKCFLPLLSDLECKPEYSFRRVDIWENHTQIIYYTTAYYNSQGDRRELIRSFKIRFEVKVKATLSRYDFFTFLTICSAYTGVFALMKWIFTKIVRYWYRDRRIDEELPVGVEDTHNFDETYALIVNND